MSSLADWLNYRCESYYSTTDFSIKVKENSLIMYDLRRLTYIIISAKDGYRYIYREALAIAFSRLNDIDIPVYLLNKYIISKMHEYK